MPLSNDQVLIFSLFQLVDSLLCMCTPSGARLNSINYILIFNEKQTSFTVN